MYVYERERQDVGHKMFKIFLFWIKEEVIDRNTDPVNKLLLAGTDPVNKLLLTGTLSNVRRCWLAMPLGACVQSCMMAYRTIEKKTKV